MGTRWDDLVAARADDGQDPAEAYAAKTAERAAASADPHGEAAHVERLAPPGVRVLDAGCGTGRVASVLAERGYRVTGVDADPRMLEVSRRSGAGVAWVHQDLSALDLDDAFEVVLLAGNVVPLVAEGTLGEVVARCAVHLARSGVVLAGFGLDEEHLPAGCPVTPFEAYAAACEDAGLRLVQQHATWEGDPWDGGEGGYVVSVFARPGQDAP